MDPTSVKEPPAAAEVALKATAMNGAANHQIVAATISRFDGCMGADGIEFIEAAFHVATRPDNGTSVPPLNSRMALTTYCFNHG